VAGDAVVDGPKGSALPLLADGEWYEDVERYLPSSEFIGVAHPFVQGWHVGRQGCWFAAQPEGTEFPNQGWKLHVSSVLASSVTVLGRTASLCTANLVPFKFAVDPTMLRLINGKGWAREGAGKFITIYPPDTETFLRFGAELSHELRDFQGPYILSDRRWPGDSRIVFYRYGTMSPRYVMTPDGEKRPLLVDPDGNWHLEVRRPSYRIPAWVREPDVLREQGHAAEAAAASSEPSLGDGRFVIKRALNHRAGMSLYLAHDNLWGSKVLIKEARPHMAEGADGHDAVERLQGEWGLLERLAGAGIAPRPLCTFTEWEHTFLAREFIEGETLLALSAQAVMPGLHQRLAQSRRDACHAWRLLALAVIDVLDKAHSAGVSLGDVSPFNFIGTVDADQCRLHVVDVEGAWIVGEGVRPRMHTPGFDPGRAGGLAGDRFGIGVLIASLAMPVFGLTELDVDAFIRVATSAARDLGLPAVVMEMLADLMRAPRDSDNTTVGDQMADLRATIAELDYTDSQVLRPRTPPQERTLESTLRETVAHLLASASPGRSDRLYPRHTESLTVNAAGLASGAAGVLYCLGRMGCEVPDRQLAWLLSRELSPRQCPPGLYAGLSGVAWALGSLGRVDQASAVMTQAERHPLLQESGVDLEHGISGVGLAALYLHSLSGDPRWRALAEHLAGVAASSTRVEPQDDPASGPRIGYGRGRSGLAMFLLATYLATQDEQWLAQGAEALTADLRRLVSPADQWLSVPHVTDGKVRVVVPYLWDGGAGVVGVALRYAVVLGDPVLWSWVDALSPDSEYLRAAYPGVFSGASGLALAQAELALWRGAESHAQQAWDAVSRVAEYGIRRPGGVQFPGNWLYRASCDLATGSAGIALVMHRVLTQDIRANLPERAFVDELLRDAQREGRRAPKLDLRLPKLEEVTHIDLWPGLVRT